MTYIDERAFIISEIAISFALEVTRYVTKMDLGYELVMNSGYSPNIEIISFYLLITAGCTLLVGWLSDSVIGKFYVILIGLVCISVACAAVATHFVSNEDRFFELSRYLILAYTATSGVRNAFLLEQWEIAMTVRNLSRFVFYLILVRVWLKSGLSALHLVWIDIKMLLVFLSFAAVVFTFSYFFFIATIGSLVYIEPTYFLVCEKCITCVFLAVKNSCKRSKNIRSASELFLRPVLRVEKEQNDNKGKKKNVSFLPKAHVRILDFDDPRNKIIYKEFDKIKVSCYGYQLMTTSVKKATGIEEKYVDLKGSIMVQKKDEKKVKPRSNYLKRIFCLPEENINYDKNINVRRIPVAKIKTISCLDNSKPVCTDLTVRQTTLFWSAAIAALPPFFFTIFMLTILEITDFQAHLVERPVEENRQISYYCFYFDAFLFPLNGFVIHPLLQEVNIRNSQIISLGCLFMFFALVITLSIQIILEAHLPYIPRSNYSQIRLYNGLNFEVTAHASWSKSRYVLFPFEYILWKDIPSVMPSYAGHYLMINDSSEKHNIIVKEQRTVTYIITEEGLVRNSEVDPSIFTGGEHTNQAQLFIVSSINRTFDLSFYNLETNIIVNLSNLERGVRKYLKPGLYNVRMEDEYSTMVDIQPKSLYSYFISPSGNEGALKRLEGPLIINYYFLFVQLCLASLANVFTSVSYYTIIIEKSPEKLRAMIFSVIVALNLTATFIYLKFIKENRFFPLIILTLHVIASAVFGGFQLFFSAYFEIYSLRL